VQSGEAATSGQWLYGAIWTFYACFYGVYFSYIANRYKRDLRWASLPGSPERLIRKQRICRQVASVLGIASAFEFIRSSNFTILIIGLLPTAFGVWVMYSIWREVFRSEMPVSSRVEKSESR